MRRYLRLKVRRLPSLTYGALNNRQEVIYEMNSTYPLIADYARHWARLKPDAPAVIYAGTTLTYGDLDKLVTGYASALRAASIRPGDRVAMLSTPRPEYWACFLAATSIGAVWTGLNPKYQLRELSHVITDSAPKLIFGLAVVEGRSYRDDLTTLAGLVNARLVFIDDDHRELNTFLESGIGHEPSDPAEVDPDAACLLVYTSGSTGAPKGAMITNRALCISFEIQAGRFTDQLCVIANLPINHIGGVGDLCCTPLSAGGTIVFQERFDPDLVFDSIERDRVTALLQVPSTLKLLAAHPRFGTADLTSLREVHWGGGPLPIATIKAYRTTGARLGTTYGMTEVTGSITYSDDGDVSDQVLSTTVGKPVPEVDLRLDPVAAESAEARSGEILVKHPGLFVGYFGREAATEEAFTEDGYFRTGDVGVFDEEGNLRLVGRTKEMYKSGGYNVYPREIEEVLEAHPAIKQAVVVPRPDERFEEVGVAYIEVAHELNDDELIAWCRDRMANYKVPKRFETVAALPLLPIGKVDRAALKDRAALQR